MRILVIEDDVKASETLKDVITSSGYICDITHTGQEGLDIIKSSAGSYEYDAIILDRVLPDMDGLDDFIPRLRCRKNKVPVIFLSALSGIDHKVKAFEFGADDYVVKPPNKNELLSRIRAVVRRTRGHVSSLFSLGNMILDFHKQVCRMKNIKECIPLTNKEYGMLELLCLYGPGAIVSKEKFINHLYAHNEPSDPKIIDVFMCKLRYKLAAANDGVSYIETVWGRGYTLNEGAAASHINFKLKDEGGKGSANVGSKLPEGESHHGEEGGNEDAEGNNSGGRDSGTEREEDSAKV